MKVELDMILQPRGELRRLAVDFLGSAKGGAARALMLVLAGTFVEGIGLLMLVPLFILILGPGEGGGLVDRAARAMLALVPAQGAPVRLAILLGVFGLLMAARSIILFNRDILIARLQVGFVHELRGRIVHLLAGSRWDVVARLRHGRITHALVSDVQSIRLAVHFLIQGTVALIMLAGLTILAVLISPPLALVIIVLLVAAVPALRPVLRRARRSGAALTEAHLGMSHSTAQFLGGLKLALSQNLERGFVREFEATQVSALRREIEFARQRSATQIALAFSTAFVGGLLLLIDLTFIGTSATGLATLLVILARTSGPASQLQQGAQQIFHCLPAYAQIKRLEAELETAQRLEPGHAAGNPPPLESTAIQFRRVSYAHPGRDGVSAGETDGVFDLDLAIEEGSWLGLTGPSGAGKTTFVDLVAGLYAPQSGEILIGGRRLDARSLEAWRNAIGYVSQDPFLFHDSLRNNLLWARPDASEDELWAQLALVGADHLVQRLPGGLDATVGERGGLLSGGERQRIALARALLRKPRLLLLDEATSAIDVEGEAGILAALRDLPNRPTIIMIAHREVSFAFVGRIVTLSQGRIASDRKETSR